MKRLILITFIACLYALPSVSQSLYSIKGTAIDTASKAKLTATITVLNAKDSILRKFTHAANDGSFTITGLPAGRFLLLVTYPDYFDYATVFVLNPANKEHNFGEIKMTPTPHMLKEVAIKASVTAIKIKGDTIEYNAKAYVVQPNDKVEDMLRQIPGIQVDKDGHITAQGERVQKVLLDGEEFFGDDPTLVTRNIRADMVDKLQVYDKKSDQATFTGVDDGKKIKTLNVVLKEDRRVGTFGKVDGGIGTDGYYEGQGLYNTFKQTQKFAVYGTASNDGKVALGGADNSRIGAGNGGLMVLNGVGGNSDQLDAESYRGRGLPESQTGGVHYDDKWNKGSESINANYKIGSLSNTTDQNSITQTALIASPSTIENNYQHIYQDLFRQKLDGSYQKTYSPTANLKIDVDGTIRHTETRQTRQDSLADITGLIINKLNSADHTKGDEKVLNAHLIFNKRFKSNRSISWDIHQSYTQSTGTEQYYSNDYVAKTNTTTIVDQSKPSTTTSLGLGSNFILTQPFTKKFALVLNYGFSLNNAVSDLRSYNQSTPGVYNVLDTNYSNNYKYNQIANQIGVMFSYRDGAKTMMYFGNRVSEVNYKQVDEYNGNIFRRNFINWNPEIDYNYRISTSQSMSLNYSGSNRQPSISQIQPVKNNSDQLNVISGNPDLRSSFIHHFDGYYNIIQQLTNQSFFINGNYALTTDPIISNQSYDSNTGKTTTQYINLAGKSQYNYGFTANAGRMINSWDARINAFLSSNGNSNYTEINGALLETKSQVYSGSIGLNKNKLKKYGLSISAGPNYTLYEFNPQQSSTNYTAAGFFGRAYANIFLPFKFQVSSDIDDTYTGKLSNAPATNNIMWNGALSKTFLKADNLKFSLSGNNLLNQDKNIRYQSGNRILQTKYNTIQRYFMFSVTWDFTKFGTIAVKK